MAGVADFFLTSDEFLEWSDPRACRVLDLLDDGFAVVSIDPAAPDGADKLVLRPRYRGRSFDDVRAGPVVVDLFVVDGFEEAHRRGTLRRQYVGEIHATREAAAQVAERALRDYEFTRGGPAR